MTPILEECGQSISYVEKKVPDVIPWNGYLSIGKTKVILLFLFVILITLVYRKTGLYLLFILVTGTITFYSKLMFIPFDVSPFFFFQIVIAKYYGIILIIPLIIFGYIIPKLMAGRGIDFPTILYIGVATLISYVSTFLQSMKLGYIGIVSSIVNYIFSGIIGKIEKPIVFAFLHGIPYLTVNILWFLLFGDIIGLIFLRL